MKRLVVVGLILLIAINAYAGEEKWKITAYCSCQKCCGKLPDHPAYGITASGRKAKYGYVACNWLPFGTQVEIEGLGVFTVMDRGAKSLFGSKTNHIKHLDIWMPTHAQARKFGVQYKAVKILKKGGE